MRSPDEIIRAAATLQEPPDTYENIELYLFFVLQSLLRAYEYGQLTKEKAGGLKTKAISNYSKDCKIYERYKHYSELIDRSQLLRIELRKNPNIRTAIELIECYSGEIGMWKDVEEKLKE